MNLNEMGKYRDPSMLILLSLSEHDKHGYMIMEDMRNNFNIDFSPGTLYGALTRLGKDGLIEPVATKGRRVSYQITPSGIELLSGHIESLQTFISIGSARLDCLGKRKKLNCTRLDFCE
ncbi:MAG: PadR family transcriptional regulator [Eubacteriaceae bacterium]|nr:PadR family transcriptional regulator [Eubacteriaceae bacterium]